MKSVRYCDAKTQTIKVSCNLGFNENEEPWELKININLPGLRVEGEPEEKLNAQTSQEIENPLNFIPTTVPTQKYQILLNPSIPQLLDLIELTLIMIIDS